MNLTKMNQTNGYIYIRNHQSYDIDNGCKLGKANNIPERDAQYATGEIRRGYFEAIFEVPIKKTGIIERLLQNEFRELNINYDAGTEFYNKKIITLIEPYLITLGIKYKKLSKQEISDMVRCNRVKKTIKKINIKSLIQILKSKKTNKQHIWNQRDYQTNIINCSKSELSSNNKIYIELPTGGGKSYIVYNLFEYLKSNFIIIISPRKIVNSQNISSKYLEILTNKYLIFNYSNDKNFDEFLSIKENKILICCTQSVNKIYESIISTHIDITNITVWFDEAHWGVEEWTNNINEEFVQNSLEFKLESVAFLVNFWLLNNTNIKYRIFTSASPNKDKVMNNEKIFGKLLSLIKVKDMIEQKWLSPIEVYIYSENKKNVENIKYIIDDFNDNKKNFGFSFHNKQQNAFNLFYNHYTKYTNKETNIKPFLLVSDNFTETREPKIKDIVLDYKYRNIDIFQNNINSIGYVVAKYSMGYDFNKLDFLSITDPKLSIQDIIQSIGRGIRPDQLGDNGSNKYKKLVISLPVYIDDNNDNNKYDKILEVLKYLLYDIGISFDKIKFGNRYDKDGKNVINQISTSNKYDGTEDIKSVLLNLLEIDKQKITNKITYDKAKKIVLENNVKDKKSYYELCDKDNRLSKEPEILYKDKFNWIDYLGIDRIYYNLETCKNKVSEYLVLYPEIKKNHLNLSIVSHELCKIDNLFPPNDLWVDYYNIKDIKYIIHITTNKKKINIII
jgi:superfamily II DNA or RNA helicase